MTYTIKEFLTAWKRLFAVDFELVTNAMIGLYPFLTGVTVENCRDYILHKFGERELLFWVEPFNSEESNLHTIGNSIHSYILMELMNNAYKYKTLYNTMYFEYVPLNNATLNETVTVTNDLQDVTGGKTDTVTETVATDDKSTTNTVTIQNSAYDSEDFRNVSKTIEQFDDDADTDVTTTQNVQGQQTDIHTGTVKTVSERAGSIGVITNQDMIQKERAVALFSFYTVIFFDLVNCITYQTY